MILVLLLFDIDGYLKRYAGGSVVIRSRDLHIGLVAKAMIQVSASPFVGSREWNDERMITWLRPGDRCARFDVKNPFGGFNLRV